MQCCSVGKDLEHILELFFACTQLPIAAITNEGRQTCSHCVLPNLNQIPPTVLEKEVSGEVEVTIKNQQAAYYLLPICPCRKEKGIFVLGPYTPKSAQNTDLTYRPKEVWPSLISLLRELQGIKHYSVCKRTDRPYCLPVHRAKRIVQKHYNRGITLDKTAERLGLNKSYLSSLFREETGQTFTEYVNEVRINESIRLLQETSDSILDIALQVGFSNQNYFSRTFKKLTGISPSEFRQRILADLD